MKYTIELTNKQKKVMDCLVEIIHRYIGFNPKFEMYREPEVITKTVTDPNADAIYEQGFEDGKNEAIHKTELIPELKKVEYTKGYNSAINDYNEMIQWLHDCTDDSREFMNKKYGYDVMYLTNPSVDEDVILYDLICDHDIAEVISEFQKWRDGVAEFKVGDEVIITGLKDEEIKGVIYQLGKDRAICLVGNSGLANIGKKDMKKTGRHFEQVEQLLSELKEKK